MEQYDLSSVHIYTDDQDAREFRSTLYHKGRGNAHTEQAFLPTGDEYVSRHSFFCAESRLSRDYVYKDDSNDGACQS